MSLAQPTNANSVSTTPTPNMQITTQLPSPANFTFMCWAMHDGVFTNHYQDIFGFSDTNNVVGIGIYNNEAAIPGNTTYFFNIGDLNSDIPGNRIIPFGEWHHYCLTLEDVPGTGTRAIGYLDGAEHVRGSLINAFPPTFAALYNTRASTTDAGAVWQGNLAAVKIWDGRALTPPQIRREMRTYRAMLNVGAWVVSPLWDFDTKANNYGSGPQWTPRGTNFAQGLTDPPVVWDNPPVRSNTQLYNQGTWTAYTVGVTRKVPLQQRY